MKRLCALCAAAACFLVSSAGDLSPAEWNTHPYSDFELPGACAACHREIFAEWQGSMMAHSWTHAWDEIEYFTLALPHALRDEKVSGVREGCIGCHSPLAFLAGDTPPPKPSAGERANESVSCEVCHTITGSAQPEPFNFSFTVSPGKVKYGPRKDVQATYHSGAYSEFMGKAEFCATCHDEQSPYGAWVKSTYREWKAGPYPAMGIQCQDCHMHYAPGTSSVGGEERSDIAHHMFQGAHTPSKLRGAVDMAISCSEQSVSPGNELSFSIVLFGGKAGHQIPTGSAEERQVWLHVELQDAKGIRHHVPVARKGFPGEEYTITSHVLAYQDMGEIMDLAAYRGLSRDGDDVPEGDRVFRKPFFDSKGRMTVCQWNTAENERVDYRIGPRETKIETFTWKVPEDVPPGKLEITAELNYRLLPSSVAAFLSVPAEESQVTQINRSSLALTVI